MREVSGKITRRFEAAAQRHGLRLEELVEGLSLSVPELLDPSARLPWDGVAEIWNRFEQQTSPAACIEEGRLAAHSRVLDPLRSIGGLLVSPRRLYFAGVRWIGPQLYSHARWSIRNLEGGRIEVVVVIPPDRRASAPWLRTIQGGLEATPSVLGLPDANVVADISPRRGVYVITPPRAPWRTWLSPLSTLSSTRSAVDALIAQEQALRHARTEADEAERLYRTLFDGVSELIAICEVDGRLRTVNAACHALGYEPAELIGTSIADLLHPDDASAAMTALERGAADGHRVIDRELRLRTRSGQYLDYDASCTSMIDNPIVRGVVLSARNVTESKAMERRLQQQEHAHASLLANLSGMAYRFDRDWTLELVSDGCLALTGYRADELRAAAPHAYADLVHEADRERLWKDRHARLAEKRTCSDEYRIVTRSGEVRWVLDIAHGVYDPDGGIEAVEGFVTDVTTRRRLEEQLAHSQRLEGLGRLAGGVAHDFNNLLGAMLGYADLAKGGLAEGDERRADIEEIERAAARAAELTRQLLALARKQIAAPKIVDLDEVVRTVDKLLRRVIGEPVHLETVLAGNLWKVNVDPGQMETVLVNLAVNARDAMPNGGTLTLETANVELAEEYASRHEGMCPGPHVVIAVSDTGRGLSEEARVHLFEPFFTTKEVGKGTGLGLAICYGIVKQNGGSIWVYSETGRGTVFKIYLPRTEATEETKPESKRPLAPGGGETILLVEDHAMLRAVAARTLIAKGYDVIQAQHGKDALARAADHGGPIHLLLTDVVMPQMTGLELAQRLLETMPETLVLYVSGYTENSVIHRGIPDAGISFLAKPFTPEALAIRVRAVLDRGAVARRTR